MADSEHDDLIWQTAVGWVMREHEEPLDATARKALVTWLRGDPARRLAYEKACYLWLLTGLIPPSGEEGEDHPPSQPSGPFPDE